MHSPKPGAARAISASDLDQLFVELGPEMGNILDRMGYGGAKDSPPLELASEEIAELLLGDSALIRRFLALGLGRDEAAVAKLNFFQKGIAIVQIGRLTFPGLTASEITQTLVAKLVEHGRPLSATATGSRKH